MKKTKIGQRVKNAFNAFLDKDIENFGENRSGFVSDSAVLRQEANVRLSEKGDVLVKMLRRAFVFLPGAFYLFFGTLSVLSFEFFWIRTWGVLAAVLIGSFMTIFGIGDIKNPKHLAIPLSIVAVGLLTFSIFSMFSSITDLFEYGIYFFPMALVVPFLAMSLSDRTERGKN